MLPIVDLFVQLMICFICWTVGSQPHLKNFDCVIYEDDQGRFLVRYTLKEGVPETMGESYYANRRSADSESLEEQLSVDNSFTQESALWRERRRGDSLTNRRECDEIIQ